MSMEALATTMSFPITANRINKTRDQLKQAARAELETEDTYYKLIALPMCMCTVAWDMIDSVIDFCVLYRVEALKGVTRGLRVLHKDYLYEYNRVGLKREQMEPLIAWCDSFLNETDGSSEIYRGIAKLVRENHPDIDSDSLSLVASAFLAWVYFESIIRFTEKEEAKFAKKIGLSSYNHMLPAEVYKARDLIWVVGGDCSIDKSLLKPFVAELIDLMEDVSGSATEPIERTRHRHRCIAYVCNKGCKKCAIGGNEFGCYPSSSCKRMNNYDKKH